MASSPVTYLTLADLCERWGLKHSHICALALDQKLAFSIGLSNVSAEVGEWDQVDEDQWQRIPHGRRCLTGIYDLTRNDAWAVIKHGQHKIDSVLSTESDGYIEFHSDYGSPEFMVDVDDLLIRRVDVERFEGSNAPPEKIAGQARNPRGGPGAPPKYDWDGFWIEACRRIHDEGVPLTQAALVRDLQDWFDANAAVAPDLSTIKKKVSKLWKALRSGDGGRDSAATPVRQGVA